MSPEVPPQESTEDSFSPPPVEKPSLGSRLVAGAIDLSILCLTFWVFVVAGEAAFSPGETLRILPSPETLVSLSIPYFLVGFGLFFGYFTLFHFLVGQTPGKMLFGLRVEGLQGEDSLLFSQAFLRSVGGLLSAAPRRSRASWPPRSTAGAGLERPPGGKPRGEGARGTGTLGDWEERRPENLEDLA